MPDLPYGRAADGTPVSFMRWLKFVWCFQRRGPLLWIRYTWKKWTRMNCLVFVTGYPLKRTGLVVTQEGLNRRTVRFWVQILSSPELLIWQTMSTYCIWIGFLISSWKDCDFAEVIFLWTLSFVVSRSVSFEDNTWLSCLESHSSANQQSCNLVGRPFTETAGCDWVRAFSSTTVHVPGPWEGFSNMSQLALAMSCPRQPSNLRLTSNEWSTKS